MDLLKPRASFRVRECAVTPAGCNVYRHQWGYAGLTPAGCYVYRHPQGYAGRTPAGCYVPRMLS